MWRINQQAPKRLTYWIKESPIVTARVDEGSLKKKPMVFRLKDHGKHKRISGRAEAAPWSASKDLVETLRTSIKDA